MAGVKFVARCERGCGTRKVGGTYIVGDGIPTGCHRIPMEIPTCKCCDQPLIWFTRNIKQIPNALKTFGLCESIDPDSPCGCVTAGRCMVCSPPDDKKTSWAMWVGSEYTPESFTLEALKYGVSKRIPHKPKDMRKGDIVYLCYRTAINAGSEMKPDWKPGVFYAFHVSEVQKIINEEDAQDPKKVAEIREKGLVPVVEVDLNDPRLKVNAGRVDFNE